MNDSTLPLRLRTVAAARPAPAPWVDEADLARIGRQFFVDCAYEYDARLRQALRAAWMAGFRAGAASQREAN